MLMFCGKDQNVFEKLCESQCSLSVVWDVAESWMVPATSVRVLGLRRAVFFSSVAVHPFQEKSVEVKKSS